MLAYGSEGGSHHPIRAFFCPERPPADGARHHLNLFVVTVGRTSISRKRTAWVRVRPVLELIDEDWVHNNIESGLSSGEGVIHRIRNKIDEEKPIKERRGDTPANMKR